MVVLERKNSWLAVAITAILAGVGGGGMAIQRSDWVYLDVDERGEAVVQLSPPPRQAEQT